MDDRETLIELLKDSPSLDAMDDDGYKMGADHLIAHGVTVQRWIPVAERLPEENGRYLCNYRFTSHTGITFTQVLDYYATDEIPHFQHTLGDSTMKVTHWMPLPEPPKEDK